MEPTVWIVQRRKDGLFLVHDIELGDAGWSWASFGGFAHKFNSFDEAYEMAIESCGEQGITGIADVYEIPYDDVYPPQPVDRPNDIDPHNPVDVSFETWRELYANNPDLLDYDQEP